MNTKYKNDIVIGYWFLLMLIALGYEMQRLILTRRMFCKLCVLHLSTYLKIKMSMAILFGTKVA